MLPPTPAVKLTAIQAYAFLDQGGDVVASHVDRASFDVLWADRSLTMPSVEHDLGGGSAVAITVFRRAVA